MGLFKKLKKLTKKVTHASVKLANAPVTVHNKAMSKVPGGKKLGKLPGIPDVTKGHVKEQAIKGTAESMPSALRKKVMGG